jgi:hypothetical protein
VTAVADGPGAHGTGLDARGLDAPVARGLDAPPRRATAIVGLAGVVVLLAGAATLGTAPAADDPAASTLAWTAGHRTRLLVAAWALGTGFALSLVFVVGLVAVLRPDGRAVTWARVAVASAAVVFSAAAVALVPVATVAFRSPDVAPATARLAWDVYVAAIQASNVPTVVMALALALAFRAARPSPAWAAPATVVLAAVHLVATTCWARSGVWSPTGPVALAPGFAYMAWVAALSIALLRADRRHS